MVGIYVVGTLISFIKNSMLPIRPAQRHQPSDISDSLSVPHSKIIRAGSSRIINLPPQHATYDLIDDGAYFQRIVVDDDLEFTATGRKKTYLTELIYHLLCILSGGIIYLICRWSIRCNIWMTTNVCKLSDASHIAIKNQWGEIQIVPVCSVPFGGKESEAFPDNKPLRDEIIESIAYFDYRYFRFIYNVRLGKYIPNYSWCDTTWQNESVANILELKSSLNNDSVSQRVSLFGKNEVDIEVLIFCLILGKIYT